MAPALVVVGAGRWFRLRWLVSVVLLLSFTAFPAWCALWRVLRGVSAAHGRVWYPCRACGVCGSTGVLQRFRGVWCCCWWCPASRRGVGADPWRLMALSGRGVVGGSSRRLGVVPGPLCGAVTGCGAGVGASLSSCRGVLPAGAGGRSCGRWGWAWVWCRALLVGCGGVPGLLKGTKKPGRYAPAFCLIWTLQKCGRAVVQ